MLEPVRAAHLREVVEAERHRQLGDPAKEAEIRDALEDPLRDRTALVIGHRLSTIQAADEVVVLDAGGITASGSHEELMEVSPLYREIVAAGGRADGRAVREREAVGL